MSDITAEIALYLDAMGHGTFEPASSGGDIFVVKVPQSPDECVVITPSGGFPSSGKHGYDVATFQVRVRGAKNRPLEPLSRAESIYGALHGLHAVTLHGGSQVVNCLGIQSGPVSIGPDENERYEYTINFQIETRNVTVNRE